MLDGFLLLRMVNTVTSLRNGVVPTWAQSGHTRGWRYPYRLVKKGRFTAEYLQCLWRSNEDYCWNAEPQF